MTIDELSHENSLIRARNERLEAEKVELLTALRRMTAMMALAIDHADEYDAVRNATSLLTKHTGSAT